MRRFVKGIVKFIIIVVPVLILVIGLGFLWLSRSLAPDSGAMSVAGLGAEATITRDRHGVPHIVAKTRADAATALGFAHAQDRLWQMEVSRMAGQGRLSELFGKATVKTDIWLRTMGIYEAAEASLSVMDPETMAMLEGYARGINAWIERNPQAFSSRLPPEYVILGVKPEPWKPADTLAAIKMMSVSLAANLGDETIRLGLARLGFSETEMNEILPYLPDDTVPPLPDLRSLFDLETGPLGKPVTTAAAAFTEIDQVLGTGASNNWVVSGSRTESGLPVLANDPHLNLMAPSIWYLAHVEVTEEFGEPRRLIGASLPGTPFVLLGRSNEAAWGFTNTGTDVQDVFVERVNPDNPDEYLTPTGWTRFSTKEETIRVKGGDSVTFTRRWTRHGPVFPEGYRDFDRMLPDNTVTALQWMALAHDDTTANAGPRLYTVRSVADFRRAMEPFTTPMQSMVVADATGDIGLIAPGRVPVRDPANAIMGRAPSPGWNAVYDWRGTVLYAELPQETNPEEGYIATANTRIVGPDYPHFLTFDWDEPYRQSRIDDLLIGESTPHSPASSRQFQADILSGPLADLKPKMLALLDGSERGTDEQAALSLLEGWDGTMSRDDGAPLVMVAWLRHFMKRVYQDDLDFIFDDWFELRGAVLMRLVDGKTTRNWCDDIKTEAEETCARQAAAALGDAVGDLKTRYGANIGDWRWGVAHKAKGEHRPFGQVGVLKRFFNVEIESGGGPFTLDRGKTDLKADADPYANTHAASYRGIFDLSNLDASTYIQTTGQSGNVFSAHYNDFAKAWADVRGIVIPATGPEEPAGVWALSPSN